MSGTKRSKAKKTPRKGDSAKRGIRNTSKRSSKDDESARQPMSLKILFRPDRAPYIRGDGISTSACVFCQSRDGRADFTSLLVYRTTHAMVVLNKFPYNTGHLLVLPIRHVAHLKDLSLEESGTLHETLRQAIAVLESEYKPLGLNVGLNLGKAAGAGLPEHMHYHIVPRWAGDLNFFPLIANTKTVIETLEQTFARLSVAFSKQNNRKNANETRL